MVKRKNIISIIGRDRVGVRNELERFIKAFKERQTDANIEICHIDEMKDFRSFEQMTLSVGLFAVKRLFVIKGNLEEKNEKRGKPKKEDTRSEQFIKIFESLDEETFILLVLDGEIPALLGKWLETEADVRRFDEIFSIENWTRRFWDLDVQVIRKVLETYKNIASLYEDEKRGKDLSFLIEESLEKLSLLSTSSPLTENIIGESILIDTSGRMFDLIDAILAANRERSLILFRKISGEINIHQFLASFIGLLRWSVYVRYLLSKKYSEKEIVDMMKLHPYVVKKALTSHVSWISLRDFYDKIISINIAYRSWKWLHDPELWRIFAIERAIMSLKK